MKHLHMLMAVLTIGLFLYQSLLVLKSPNSTHGRLGKSTKIITHIFYTLLVISGIILVMPLLSLNVPLQWVAAKVVLLIAAVSASIKAFRPSSTRSQALTGILITAIAYAGIVILAFTKPGNLF